MSWICRVDGATVRYIEVTGPWRNAKGKVCGMTAAEQISWAESLDCRLPTAEELDAIYYEADVAVVAVHPIEAPLTALDADIANALIAHGVKTERVYAGKSWILSERATKSKAVNYGLHGPDEETKGSGSYKRTWKGIAVRPDATGHGWVIQTPGAVHGYTHKDWSQLGYAIRDVEAPFERVDTDPPDTVPAPISIDEVAEVVSERAPVIAGPTVASLVDRTIEARNYTKAKRELSTVRRIVLHCVEQPIRTSVAASVANWFASVKAPQASAHFIQGPEELIACVPLEHVAWAAPGCNRDGVQIEMVGQAYRTEWRKHGTDDAAGYDVMARTAKLVAALCRELNIPAVRLDAAALLRGEAGITTHDACRQAFKKSTHTDPGGKNDARWPWGPFLHLVGMG
jgi:hypothetical protein